MFQARDYSIFLPSPNAERAFRKLQWLDLAVKVLIALLAILCLWNIGQLIQLRQITNQDLGDVRSISDALSTRLIWIVTVLAVAMILVREWLTGFTTMGLLIPTSVLFGLVLVPAVMTEIQPPLEEQSLRIELYSCPPKAIVNDKLSSIGRCEPRAIPEDDVLLAVSDPTAGSFTTLKPVAGGQNAVTYSMDGRGTYTVYFMFRYDDMDSCNRSTIFPRSQAFSSVKHTCLQYNDSVWKVYPHTTSSNRASGMYLVEVIVP